jgi:cardiolipin synthase
VTIPNLLSLFRMGLIPLFVIAVLEHEPVRALGIFVLAGLTDALDGILARVLRQQSLLGMYLDPMADKLLLVSAYVMLSIPSANDGVPIPLWVTVLVFARDLLIVTVALVLHLSMGVSRFPPTWLSKFNTVAQVACVLLVLLSAPLPMFVSAAQWATILVGVSTLASGVDYIFRAHGIASRAEAASAVTVSPEPRRAPGDPGSPGGARDSR